MQSITIESDDRKLLVRLIDWLNKQEVAPNTNTTIRLGEDKELLSNLLCPNDVDDDDWFEADSR